MKTYKNNESFNNNMINKTFIFMIMIMTLFSVSYAVDQELLRYQFEEGGGSIVLDTSGNNFHATNNNAKYQDTEVAFGTYALDFDGGSDYVTSINPSSIQEQISFSFWADFDTNNQDVLFHIYDTTDSFKLLFDSNSAGSINLQYLDVSNIQRTHNLSSTQFALNNMYHFALNFDFINQSFEVYINNVLDATGNIDFQVSRESSSSLLRLGADRDGNVEFDGDIDEFRVFNFILSDTQISSLYNTNTIDIYVAPEEEPEYIEQLDDIINLVSLEDGDSVPALYVYEVSLLKKADCDLYIDNSLYYAHNNSLGFSKVLLLENGLHTSFLYCEYVLNNSLYWNLTSIIEFNITDRPPQQVTFNIIGNDFNSDDLDLWITSPCLDKGIGGEFTGKDYQPYMARYNPNGAYFSKVIDGYASFNLTPETHEFCLFHGRIIVNSDGKTNNYDVVSHEAYINLGNIDIPNNTTSTFTIKLDEFDIYEVYNPKAWGKSWTGVIGGLMLLILGMITLFAGFRSDNGKIVFSGVILVLSALGISIGGFIGVLL